MRSVFPAVFSFTLLEAGTAFSQESPPPHLRNPSAQQPSQYAGQQTREIKALSPAQTQDLLAGKGMELAKAAELNGYPEPMHVLELADSLQLSPEQRSSTTQLLAQRKAEARTIGGQLIAAERELDGTFAAQNAQAEAVARLTQLTGTLQAALSNAHLQTHLIQTRLLSPKQVLQYVVLRGYGSGSSSSPSHH